MGNVEKRVTAKLVLDDTGYSQTLKGVNSGLKEVKSEFKLASEGLKTYGKNSEQLKNTQQALTKQLELQSKKVDLYRKSIEQTNTKMQENVKERNKLKSSLENTSKEYQKIISSQSKELESYRKNQTALEKLNKKYDETKKKFGENSEQANKLKDSINKLEEKQKQLISTNQKEIESYEKTKNELEKVNKSYENKNKAIESNAKAIQNYQIKMNNANSEMTRTQGHLNNINNNLMNSNNKWKSTSESLDKHSQKLHKTGEVVSSVGNSILGLSAPLVVAGGAALACSSNFESGMSEVSAISGATGDDLNKLSEKAKEMGAKTKFSASESAEALKYMAMAGWKTNDMLDGLSGIMNLAAASGEDLGSVSDICTDALTAFGMKASDSGHFADILASASSNANTNVGMLGDSFKYCAPIFGAVGYNAEDCAFSLGLMANAGIKGLSKSGSVTKKLVS